MILTLSIGLIPGSAWAKAGLDMCYMKYNFRVSSVYLPYNIR
jgi:hypothetical protein